MNKLFGCFSLVVLAFAFAGCTTKTHRISANESVQTVAGFSDDDIADCVSRAVQSIISLDRIKLKEGATRAVMIVDDVKNDTTERGLNASALAESLGQSLREELTNSRRVAVYNPEVAKYAKVAVEPQYRLVGRLAERNLRQDDGDFQKEYQLNLTLFDLDTGLEFWQKRIPLRKLVADKNLLN